MHTHTNNTRQDLGGGGDGALDHYIMAFWFYSQQSSTIQIIFIFKKRRQHNNQFKKLVSFQGNTNMKTTNKDVTNQKFFYNLT